MSLFPTESWPPPKPKTNPPIDITSPLKAVHEDMVTLTDIICRFQEQCVRKYGARVELGFLIDEETNQTSIRPAGMMVLMQDGTYRQILDGRHAP